MATESPPEYDETVSFGEFTKRLEKLPNDLNAFKKAFCSVGSPSVDGIDLEDWKCLRIAIRHGNPQIIHWMHREYNISKSKIVQVMFPRILSIMKQCHVKITSPVLSTDL